MPDRRARSRAVCGSKRARSASVSRSTSPASTSAPTNRRSFSRKAASLATHRSCGLRQSPVRPFVPGPWTGTRRSSQPAGRTAVSRPTPCT
jgi:hypothetical protein